MQKILCEHDFINSFFLIVEGQAIIEKEFEITI